MTQPSPAILMLSGPTAVGKTALAVALAQRHRVELISADSMQVYRGMAIGTAQPTGDERRQAVFHVSGTVDPAEPFNVHRFLTLCDAAHRTIVQRGATPLYVGGTGLYLRALRWGLLPEGDRDDSVRAALEAEAAALGPAALHRRLAAVDPRAAARIAPTDALRIVRALEVQTLTGRPISELQSQWDDPHPRFPHRLVILDMPRELLRERIALRTRQMLDAGWIDETRALLEGGLSPASHCFKALGYREILEHLQGTLSRAALEECIILRTGQFARRQMTWLRREREALWLTLDPQNPNPTLAALEEALTGPM